ncbi:uncharacterized protein AB9X84_020918 [Acanthopagrus schlegelii]
MMSGDSKSRSFSESLVLDDTEKGVIITGITDDTIAAETGLQAGDEIVAATIHLDHLNKHEVMNILKVLEPYDNNMKVLTKKELTSADLGSLGFGLKDPVEILNLKKDLSLDASTEAPVVSLDQSRELNTVQGLGGEISGPTLNGDLPSLSLNMPPGLTGPNIKGDLGGNVKAPEVSVATPQVITPSSSLDIKKPEIKTGSLKYKPPVFQMPNFNQSAPDLKPPDLDLNDPDVNLKAMNADIRAPSGKIQWPHLKWKGPKVKRPDADLPALETSLSSPSISGDFSKLDVDCNVPKTDINGPDLHIQTPNLNSETPSKINWPHFKWKKPKPTGPKADLDLDSNLNKPDVDLTVPKVEGGINAPDAEIHLPNLDIKGPNLDMKKTDTEVVAPSGNIQWPHLKWKKPKGPKSDLNLPNQEIDGDIKVHDTELSLPKADLNCPDVDVQAPDCDIDASSDKHWPHLKWKKNKIHGPKTDAKLNADLSTPDVDLSVPKIDGEISTDADIEAPSGKFRMPTFKKPKFLLTGAKVKSPEVDLDAETKLPDISLSPEASLDGPDVDLNLTKPEVRLTNVDSGPPSEKFKWPTLKKPKWSASGPKAESPGVDLDTDVSALDLSPSAPKTDIEISAKDANLNLPNGPLIETNSTDVPGKFKWFNFKRGQKDEIDANVKVPDVDLKGPDVNLSAPDVNLSEGVIEAPDSQRLSVSIPNADVDHSGPDLDLGSFDGKLNLPQIKQPKLNIDVNPNVDLKATDLSLPAPQIESWDAPAPDINLPSIDLKNTDVDLQAPEADIRAGLGESPSGHLSVESGIEVPKVNIGTPVEDGNISVPAADLGVPKAQGDVKGPDIDIKAPNVDVDLEKSKMPHFKLPKFDFLGSNTKAPKVDISKNLEVSPDLIKASTDGEFSSPHVSASAPEVKTSLSTPELDITAEADAEVKGSQKSKLRWPFKLGLKSGSGTDEEGSGVDSETDVSNTEVEVPVFKFHRLPRNSFDGIGGISDTLGLSKLDTEEKDYIVSKGIRLPIVNATSKMGENINIMERLKMAKDKATSANVSPTEAKTDIDLKLDAPEKPESGLGLVAHGISSSDENDKLSLGLSNMLGLNIKDSDAD